MNRKGPGYFRVGRGDDTPAVTSPSPIFGPTTHTYLYTMAKRAEPSARFSGPSSQRGGRSWLHCRRSKRLASDVVVVMGALALASVDVAGAGAVGDGCCCCCAAAAVAAGGAIGPVRVLRCVCVFWRLVGDWVVGSIDCGVSKSIDIQTTRSNTAVTKYTDGPTELGLGGKDTQETNKQRNAIHHHAFKLSLRST